MPRLSTYDPHCIQQNHGEFRTHLVVCKCGTRDGGTDQGPAHVARTNLVEGARNHVIAALRAGAKRRVKRSQLLKLFFGDFFERVSHAMGQMGNPCGTDTDDAPCSLGTGSAPHHRTLVGHWQRFARCHD